MFDDGRRKSMKALVVDDSTVMRKVLIGALSRAGIEDVDQAADGHTRWCTDWGV